jgi:hypothetical protein
MPEISYAAALRVWGAAALSSATHCESVRPSASGSFAVAPWADASDVKKRVATASGPRERFSMQPPTRVNPGGASALPDEI